MNLFSTYIIIVIIDVDKSIDNVSVILRDY